MTLPPPPDHGNVAQPPRELAVRPAPGQPSSLRRRGDALPSLPVPYHRLLRGPRRHWWRPPLSLLLVVVFGFVAMMTVFLLGDLTFGGPRALVTNLGGVEDDLSPASMLTLDLVLAVLIPVSGLATWVAHRIRPGFVSSVAGRLRWRWLARCVLVALPVWAIYLTVAYLLEPPASGRPAQWVLLLVMAVVLTPFQAAGEEYLFRGWLTQNVAAYFSHPMVGLVVSTLVSATLFSLAHGSFDPWVLLSIATLAVAACYANWRTGGLEAGIAMHLVNNVLLGVLTTTVGGYADSFVSETTTATPLETGIGVLVHAVAVALILWQARRLRIQRHFQPVELSAPARPLELGTGSDAALEPATWYAPLGRAPGPHDPS